MHLGDTPRPPTGTEVPCAFLTFKATPLRGQRGFTLIEVLIALGIFGFIGVGLMSALGTGYRAQDINREQVRGQNLARAALEEIRFLPYRNSATPSPYYDDIIITIPTPAGYSISVETLDFCLPPPDPCTPDGNIQKNTVKVFRGAKGLVTIEDLKTRR